MRLLLDESLPQRLKAELHGHRVLTVTEIGWAGISNGDLLARASGVFDVFITADQKLRHQQNLDEHHPAVVVLAAPTNRIEDYQPLVPRLLKVLTQLRPGQVLTIS